MRRPSIGIPIPTSFDPAYNGQCWPEFAAAVRAGGAEPVALELGESPATTRQKIVSLDAFVLPGSPADVQPALYGKPRNPETADADEQRESMDRLILETVEASGKPLLAICFGLQYLNVFRGGTLIQDLQPVPVNHRAGRAIVTAHAVAVEPGSRLAAISEGEARSHASRPMINSSHHQGIGVVGEGLQRVAWCPEDGVVEGVEGSSHPWLVGVQWHPERILQAADPEVASFAQAIFGALVTAAAARA